MSGFFDFLTQHLFPTALPILMVMLFFGGTVLVHELGHFLTAKWFGLRIDAFSIGMGPAIWQKKINGVVYKIAWLPIGGYVALPQLDITGSAFENEDAKNGKLEEVAPWKRIIIALAGPFMNVVTALVLSVIIWQAGKQPDPGFQEPVVSSVYEDGGAYEAGLRGGDRIYRVNDDKAVFWADVQMAAMLNEKLDLKIIRDGEVMILNDVPTREELIGKRKIRFLDVRGPVMPPVTKVIVEEINVDDPAYRAGIELGDRILEVDGTPISHFSTFVKMVNKEGSDGNDITIERKGETQTFRVTPKTVKDEIRNDQGELIETRERKQVGVLLKHIYMEEHPPPLRQIQYFKGQIFRTLVAFTRPQERAGAAGSVGGPVLILSSMHSQIKDSLMTGLWFTALININLAILNLLPLIILDGGHIMVALFEIFTGRKPYRRLIIAMANVMVVFLIGVMVLFVFRDSFFLYNLKNPEPTPSPSATPAVQEFPPDPPPDLLTPAP